MDLLIDDMYEARKNGYQQIHSPRGARAARAREREKQQDQQQDQQEITIHKVKTLEDIWL